MIVLAKQMYLLSSFTSLALFVNFDWLLGWLVVAIVVILTLTLIFLPINKFNGLRLVIHERRMHLNLL